jgi:asparagine synthase (glutamine-hydrolysing)
MRANLAVQKLVDMDADGSSVSCLPLRNVNVFSDFAGVAEWRDFHLSVRVYAQGESYRWTSLDPTALAITAELHEADPVPTFERFARHAEQDVHAALRNLTGSFALAFCQTETGRFVLATDHFGIRPIYYRRGGNRLVFGTQLVSLVALLDELPDIDLQSVYHYLNFSYVPGPRTIYQQTFVLSPGAALFCCDDALQVSPYWHMSYPADATATEEELAFRLRQEIGQAVRKAALIDGNNAAIGTFLSGGTDSGAIAGILAQITSPLKAYSIAFGEDEYNELHYAKLLARSFGLNHYVHQLTADELLESIPLLLQHCDQPFGNPSIVATWRCARLAADNGTTILLAGDGGDEIFGGNERYAKDSVYGLYYRFPAWLRWTFLALAQHLPGQSFFVNRIRNFTYRGNTPNPERFYMDDAFASKWWETLVHPHFARHVCRDSSSVVMRSHFQQARAGNEFDRLMYVDLQMAIWGNDLPKVMTAARIAGIRVRFPFLDPDLALFTGALPRRYKVRGLNKRYLFKRAVADILPSETLNKTKHGFGVPVAEWMRTDRRVREAILDPLFSPRSFLRSCLTEMGVQRIVDEHMRGDWDYGMWLWALMMMERWMDARRSGCRHV